MRVASGADDKDSEPALRVLPEAVNKTLPQSKDSLCRTSKAQSTDRRPLLAAAGIAEADRKKGSRLPLVSFQPAIALPPPISVSCSTMLRTILRATAPSRRLIPSATCWRAVTTSSTAASPTSSIDEAPTATTTTPKPRYVVSRTHTKNLPVYLETKRGGNLKITTIKKVDGDKQLMRQNLAEAMGLGEDQVQLNPTTGHIVVKASFPPSLSIVIPPTDTGVVRAI
jgi:large subunit ribosomal protein L49